MFIQNKFSHNAYAAHLSQDKFRILDGRFPDPVQVDEDGVPLVTNEPPTPQETRLRAYLELKKNEHRLAGKTPLKKVPRDVLYRLVKRPEDTAPLVREALLDYMKVHDCLEKALRSMGKDVVVTLQIDGSQSPDAVLFHFRSVWKRVVGVLVRLAAVATAVRPLVANGKNMCDLQRAFTFTAHVTFLSYSRRQLIDCGSRPGRVGYHGYYSAAFAFKVGLQVPSDLF